MYIMDNNFYKDSPLESPMLPVLRRLHPPKSHHHKKRKTTMSAADLLARLNIQCRDIVTFYENNRVQPNSLAMLNKLIDTKNFIDFLDLVESYSRSMPFIDHDEFTNSLAKAWTLYSDSVNLERKALLKKIKALQEDKKTDPDVITRQENLLVEVEDKKLRALLATTRVRAMTKLSVEYFKMDPNFDYKEKYAQVKNGSA